MGINLLTSTWDNVEELFDPAPGPNWSSDWSGPGLGGKGIGAAGTGSMFSSMGLITQSLGAVTSAVGAYFGAKSQQYQAKSQASSDQFQATMARMNASADERNAETILEAGKSQVANYTMGAGQQKAESTASMASHGIALGVGSAADVSASQDVVKDINVRNININAVTAAAAERTQGANEEGAATIYDASARNALLTAKSISPIGSGAASLLGSAAQIGSQWDWRNWMRQQGYGGGN